MSLFFRFLFLASCCFLLFRLRNIFLLLHQLFKSYFIDLDVLLDHHPFEGHEIVNRKDLLRDSIVVLIVRALLKSSEELLTRDVHLCYQFAKQIVYDPHKVLSAAQLKYLIKISYFVDASVLEFVLFLVVEDDAVVLNETDDGRLPAGALEEGD